MHMHMRPGRASAWTSSLQRITLRPLQGLLRGSRSPHPTSPALAPTPTLPGPCSGPEGAWRWWDGSGFQLFPAQPCTTMHSHAGRPAGLTGRRLPRGPGWGSPGSNLRHRVLLEAFLPAKWDAPLHPYFSLPHWARQNQNLVWLLEGEGPLQVLCLPRAPAGFRTSADALLPGP